MTAPPGENSPPATPATRLRRWVLVLGDQLSLDNPALADFDPAQDRVLMIEAAGEATLVWNHKARLVVFLSAMRHFRQRLAERGWPCHYLALTPEGPVPGEATGLPERLAQVLRAQPAAELWACEAGEWRLQQAIEAVAEAAQLPLRWHSDSHFLCSKAEFAEWAEGRKEWRMEHFYRSMRRRHRVLMEGTEPVGGAWNFDAENRKAYPKSGPGLLPQPPHFAPDACTREVMALVERRFAQHPGSLADFGWPVTREQGLQALQAFVEERLLGFGTYQDAMWRNTPFGWHSLLSVALNLHLIHPREVIAAAEAAWASRGAPSAPLPSVEGFVRQVLGWREFIRGVYWHTMPGLAEANHFGHQRALPTWYWSGQTQMACMKDNVEQSLLHGYAHHIQRLMLTGQFALLAELAPRQVADWYLAMYVDAVDWVELPNVMGMALFADGGRFTSKPYIASGQYIHRMSNLCQGCRYRPEQATGPQACPVTTLYWHFLDRHESALAANPRSALMVKNLQRKSEAERSAIRQQAAGYLEDLNGL